MTQTRPGLLSLKNCALDSEDLAKLCNFAGTGRVRVRFTEIDLSHNTKLHGGGRHLGRLLVRIPPCDAGSALTLDNCNLQTEDIQAMHQVIQEEQPTGKLNIRKLNLSNNHLKDSGKALAEILERMPAWSNVTLVNCGLSSLDMQRISKSYASMNINGLKLDLSGNDLSGAGETLNDIMVTNKYF